MVCRALETGKAVFVEKPLALTESDLERVIDVIAKTGNDRLMVGFNRRFSPLLEKMQSQFGQPRNATARYLVNAGPLAADSWYTNEELEGSRFTGEGGHFIDTLSWWMGSLPAEVYAISGPEKGDVHATIRFQNGSAGTISYITGGNSRYQKETLDAAGAGRSARLDNFRKATVWNGRKENATKARPDKGQAAQLEKFTEACLTGGPMPISVESVVATTRATIAVGESLLSSRPERV
jgi:predicted dehydrogenase